MSQATQFIQGKNRVGKFLSKIKYTVIEVMWEQIST